jgi:hypothetical protein
MKTQEYKRNLDIDTKEVLDNQKEKHQKIGEKLMKVKDDHQEWRMGVIEKNKLRMKDNQDNKLKIK